MTLDPEGLWIEYPLPGSETNDVLDGFTPDVEAIPLLPPDVSDELIDLVDSVPIVDDSDAVDATPASWSAPVLLRLPE